MKRADVNKSEGLPVAEPAADGAKKHGKKIRAVLIALLCVLVILAVSGLVFKDRLTAAYARRLIDGGRYGEAVQTLERSDDPVGTALKSYAELRREIKSGYPEMLKSADIVTLTRWRDSAVALQDNPELGGEKCFSDLHALAIKLRFICSACAGYDGIRDQILDVMDVFLEYNRLHLTGGDGNVTFTPSEELKKLEKWQNELNNVIRFASSIQNYESVYLFSYLVREAQGEIEQLKKDVQTILDGGYDLNDTVRYSDNKGKTFPTVSNLHGVRLNVAQKEDYEAQLRLALEEHLISSQLVAFYAE